MFKKSSQPYLNGSIFSNFFLGLFLIFLRPWILEANLAVIFENQKIYALGFLIIFVIILDVISILYKVPALASRSSESDIEDVAGWGFFLWIGHMVVSVILGMAMLQAFGYDIESDSTVGPLIMIGLVTKDIVLFGYLAWFFDSKNPPRKNKEKYLSKEFIGDIATILYITIAYTLTWESLAVSDPISAYPPAEQAINTFAALLTFLIIFFPLRMIYVMQDIIFIKNNQQRVVWTLSFLFAIFAGMLLLF